MRAFFGKDHPAIVESIKTVRQPKLPHIAHAFDGIGGILPRDSEGKSSAPKMARIAITTSSSISVKANEPTGNSRRVVIPGWGV